MPKKSKNISKWLTYEEVQAKTEYQILFNQYYRPYVDDWADRIPPNVMKHMQELYIKAGDSFPGNKK